MDEIGGRFVIGGVGVCWGWVAGWWCWCGGRVRVVVGLLSTGLLPRHPGFFFKQKTAYEILRSDWSSDVCSSD
eukprot:COSAG02_NODE_51172_length_316_cov_0.373272_1_plen_72_part_10